LVARRGCGCRTSAATLQCAQQLHVQPASASTHQCGCECDTAPGAFLPECWYILQLLPCCSTAAPHRGRTVNVCVLYQLCIVVAGVLHHESQA
jgi:hypothetical protein